MLYKLSIQVLCHVYCVYFLLGLLFHFLNGVFDEQMALLLMKSDLLFFSSHSECFLVLTKGLLMVGFSPVLPSRSHILLALTNLSLTHFA